MAQYNVGNYLTTRLQQLGVNHLFSVPGDYTSDFLEIVDTQSQLKRIGNCNELNAGYAADGYARANGLGAVAVTTGVGAFSLLNAIGGSFVESIPVVAIIGTLSNTKLLDEINAGQRYHHNVNDLDFNRIIYAQVTVAFERITNPLTAPAQIDAALIACISQSKPVGIEIMEDCYYMPCDAPVGNLIPIPSYEPMDVLVAMANATPPNKYAKQIVSAITDAANQIYNLLVQSKKPVFWVGSEFTSDRIQYLFNALQQMVKAPYVSSLLGKAAISEDNPWYIGMYNGVFTTEYTTTTMEGCDCLIGLGVWDTDLNTFGVPTNAPGNPATIFASRNMVKIGIDLYVQVTLEHLLQTLIDIISVKGYQTVWAVPAPPAPPAMPTLTDKVTYDDFFNILNRNITTSNLIVAEIGLSTFGGSSFLKINRQNGFLGQTIWASIGWSIPAGLGASFTNQSRAFVICGDGAFKLTCQEISTMVMEKRNTVIFILNNKVYAVEQILLDPAPFKSNAPFEAANVLQPWDYVSLMKAFSNNDPNAMSANVYTNQDLVNVLTQIENTPNATWLVNIDLNERDYPSAWAPFVGS